MKESNITNCSQYRSTRSREAGICTGDRLSPCMPCIIGTSQDGYQMRAGGHDYCTSRPPRRANAGRVRVDWRRLCARTLSIGLHTVATGMVASNIQRLEVERKLRLYAGTSRQRGPSREMTGNISTLTACTQPVFGLGEKQKLVAER